MNLAKSCRGLTRRIRGPVAVTVVFTLWAGVAAAGVPFPPNCTVDHVIIGSFDHLGAMAGVASCSPTATRGFDVEVRDVNNVPVANSVVQIVFAGTGTSIRPA